MRRRSHILGSLALLLAAAGFACSLNPQPFPPATFASDNDAGASSDATRPFADGSVGDAGGTPDSSPPPAEAGADAGDAGGDATTDGGDAEAPTDAALAEGG